MDLYLSAQDTLSLQEMLDCDIKTEIDNVLGCTDLSLSLSELPPLDLDDALAGPGDMTMWFTGSGCLNSGNSNSSNSNFNLDFVGGDAAAMMVNPSSVVPMTLVTVQSSTAFTDVSSSSTNLATTSSKSSSLSPVEEKERTFPISTVSTSKEVARSAASSTSFTSTNSLLRKPQTSATIRIATSSTHSSNNVGLPSTIIKTVPVISTSTKIAQSQHQKQLTQIQVSNIRTVPISHLHNKRQSQLNNNNNKHFSAAEMDYDERPFPKPAYSYSCLIAMALKNSKTGSLPVSEIYNFMCEHFPYFKTAPNGWKNSVRHNLSLNKCFEKIEKPAGNGSQRKGCLWAMNPAKIAKMDEEVQKWSKKDPMAIRKAMICPENLEMLERGEMKREFSGLSSFSGGCSTSLSEGEESDEDLGGSAPATPLSPASQHNVPEFIDINELNGHESIDESSLTGFDIEVAEGIYEELDADDDKLNLGITLTSAAPNDFITTSSTRIKEEVEEEEEEEEYVESRKRSRLNGSTIQGNYVYKPMVSSTVDGSATVGGSRRKAPLLLRASPSASSLIKLEDP